MYNGMHITADLSQYDMLVIIMVIFSGLLVQTLLILAFIRFSVTNLEYRLLQDENQRLKAELKEIAGVK